MQDKVVPLHNKAGRPWKDVWLDGKTLSLESAMPDPGQLPATGDEEVERLRALLVAAGIDPDGGPPPTPAFLAARAELEILREENTRLRGETARATGTYRLALSLGQARLAASRAELDRVEAILQSAVDFAIIATDLSGTITIWNEGAARILGWTAADVEGRSAAAIFTPEDCAEGRPEAEMAEALAEGRADDERWHVRRDGSRFFASGTMTPMRDDEGRTTGFLKILRDRTERRLAEEQLSESEAFTRSVLAASRDCIMVLDAAGFVATVNGNGLALLEAPTIEVLRERRWIDFWDSDAAVAARDAMAAAEAGGTGRFQAAAATMAGAMRWWDVIVTQVSVPGAPWPRLLVVSRDVTASKEATLRIAHSARRLQTVLDTIPVGVLIADAAGRIVEGNERAAEILKHTPKREPADADASPWKGHHEDGTLVEREDYPLRRVLDAREARASLEVDYERGDGSRAWVSFEAAPIRDASGSINGAVVAISDIDARKKAEERQRFLMGELSHRVKNILAVVVSVARQTLRNATTLEDASEALLARIGALAGAHDVLMQHHWASADMSVLIAGAMKIHDNGGNQISMGGPEVRLGSQAALSLALVLHELGTNAVKYGALSDPDGRLAIAWHVETRAGEPHLVFRWQETLAEPMQAPQRVGFGSRLIRHSLSSFGTVAMDYAPGGFVLDFASPLARIQKAEA